MNLENIEFLFAPAFNKEWTKYGLTYDDKIDLKKSNFVIFEGLSNK